MRPLHWEEKWWKESPEKGLVIEDKMRFKPRTLVDTFKEDKRKEAEASEETETGSPRQTAKDHLRGSKEVSEVYAINQLMRPTKPDMAENLTKYKARLKKGGRIPWWHKLIDDTIRDNKKDINPNLEADRFRQRSSGHGAQGLNSRHVMRAWGPNEKPIIERKISSRINLAGLNEEGDMNTAKNKLLEKRTANDTRPCTKRNIDEKDPKNFILKLTTRKNRGQESDEDEY